MNCILIIKCKLPVVLDHGEKKLVKVPYTGIWYIYSTLVGKNQSWSNILECGIFQYIPW